MFKVSLLFDKVVISVGDLPQCVFYRSKLAGFQSWKYGDNNYHIEFTFDDGAQMECEFDDFEKWRAVLTGLQGVL